MVTRRAVLKGTAAASIGAIAAAHGATPVDAAGLSCGFGNLAGGAVAGFYKERSAFQVSLKFHKFAADIFIKEQATGGVAIFSKFFDKQWVAGPAQELSADMFPDLKLSELSFLKVDEASVDIFLKNELQNSLVGTISIEADKLFYKWREVPYNPDGEIIT